MDALAAAAIAADTKTPEDYLGHDPQFDAVDAGTRMVT